MNEKSNLLDVVAAELAASAAGHRGTDRPVVVAVEGRSAAGKSTLAKRLAAAVANGTTVIEMDDFYRVMDPKKRAALTPRKGVDSYFDWQRLAAEVLSQLRVGTSLRFATYDWDKNQLAEEHGIDVGSLVLVEGVYSARPELRPYIDCHILVETPTDERRHRQLARGQSSIEWIRRWAAAESLYFDEVYVADPDFRVHGS